MAQQGLELDREKFCCSLCLDLLEDPVTIPCGHSYCRKCITSHWRTEEEEDVYSCPQCRQTFQTRPALVKNTMLADLVKELKKTRPSTEPIDHAGAGDVACDLCPGRKRKARKSCLQCLVSYCEQHLEPHYKVVPLKKHKLIEASANLQENTCSRHSEVMKIFCRTDQQCICYLCAISEHKGHDTVSAAAEMTKKQRELGPSRQEIQRRIQAQENHVKMLQQEVEYINRSADKAVIKNENLSTELVNLIMRESSAVKSKIRSQQDIEVSRAKELQAKLKQELVELKRKDTELGKLTHTQDQIHFLHRYISLSPLNKLPVLPTFNPQPLQYFDNVTTAVSETRDKLLRNYIGEWRRISLTVTEVDVLLPQNPKTKAEFSQYAVHKNQLMLNPNTANTQLTLSEDKRKAISVKTAQSYGQHPERFMHKSQVLSRQHLTGRCYWEVHWTGLGVSIAVAYKDIARTGTESVFGNDGKSWVLECSSNGNYTFKHKGNKVNFAGRQSSTIGVFMDHKAGILSFYEVSKTITLLHKVQTTFTQPLHVGLGVCYFGSTAEFCEVK
ncbi:tripartite motif-containing protein 16-like [Seriola aureovittata]|uniref:tripartite motif-containing protein 16-like n=1 Tax=Seriola aureovittata TaxID=2871759 RepID=UPI0024BE9BDF|nr:tripartite motif-containing protein 16-like [Seriola aureovittata]